MTGVAKNTVTKLLVDLGTVCSIYQDRCATSRASASSATRSGRSSTRSRRTSRPRSGEFGYGDVWTWVAIDADTKLVPSSWSVGARGARTRRLHARPGRAACNRVQLTTDGQRLPRTPSGRAFEGDVDYARSSSSTAAHRAAGTAATARPCASARQNAPSRATPNPATTSRPATSSGRTSRCGWACAASRG